jgi:hypothetical protein
VHKESAESNGDNVHHSERMRISAKKLGGIRRLREGNTKVKRTSENANPPMKSSRSVTFSISDACRVLYEAVKLFLVFVKFLKQRHVVFFIPCPGCCIRKRMRKWNVFNAVQCIKIFC